MEWIVEEESVMLSPPSSLSPPWPTRFDLGVRMSGISRGVPRGLPAVGHGGSGRDGRSGREEAPPQRQGEATPSRTCTQVGPGARPDPSDDQVSDVERVVLKMSLMLPDVAACRGRTVPLMAYDIATGVAWRTELPQGMGEL
ncbi:hypothetical protein C4D60_Mb06t27910 [Musa balbisiana]|uniref:Uncharacterized protein n=1 Tax=Musa balbisiana TaxID=52838 RepID=A0A4S8IR75_MUSBA|nr:hypothetical protein C4D60_Mb06t27910 [Musa balbisiana]